MSNEGNDTNFTRSEFLGTASAPGVASRRCSTVSPGEDIRPAIESRADTGWGWLSGSAVVSFLLGTMIGSQLPVSGIRADGMLVGFAC